MKLDSCPNFSFYRCEFALSCGHEKIENCATDFLNSFDENEVSTLVRDARKRGLYYLMGIEAHVVRLDKYLDRDVYDEDGRVASFRLQKNGRHLKPLELETRTRRQEDYYIRGSELLSDCEIARIISKIRKPIKVRDELSLAGTALHKVCNQQPNDSYVHNKTLEELGLNAIPRSKYCEKEVFSFVNDIPVLAHVDAVLTLDGSLVVFDLKRAAQTRRQHVKQILLYAEAINKHKKFEDYFLVTIPHANFIFGKPANPRYTIVYIDKNSRIASELKEEISSSFYLQRRLLKNRDYLNAYKQEQWKRCTRCYPTTRTICDYMFDNRLDFKDFLDVRI